MKNLIPGVYIGNVDDVVTSSAIQNLKLTDGEQVIITPLINAEGKIITKTHFNDEGIGQFYCFGGICCDKEKPARVYNHIPVLKYDCMKQGRNLVIDPNSEAWEVVNLKMYKDKMNTYMDLMATYGDLSSKNIKIVCKDAKYQDWDFIVLPDNEAAWKSIPAISSQLEDQRKFYFNNIVKSIAKSITEQEYIQLKKQAVNNANNASNDANSAFGDKAVNSGSMVNSNAVNNTPALQAPPHFTEEKEEVEAPAQKAAVQQPANPAPETARASTQAVSESQHRPGPFSRRFKKNDSCAHAENKPAQPQGEKVSNDLDDVMASMFPDGGVSL